MSQAMHEKNVPSFSEFLANRPSAVREVVPDPIALTLAIDALVNEIQNNPTLIVDYLVRRGHTSATTNEKMTAEEWRNFYASPQDTPIPYKEQPRVPPTKAGTLLDSLTFNAAYILAPPPADDAADFNEAELIAYAQKVPQSLLLQYYLGYCLAPLQEMTDVSLTISNDSEVIQRLQNAKESVENSMTEEQRNTYIQTKFPAKQSIDELREKFQSHADTLEKSIDAKLHAFSIPLTTLEKRLFDQYSATEQPMKDYKFITEPNYSLSATDRKGELDQHDKEHCETLRKAFLATYPEVVNIAKEYQATQEMIKQLEQTQKKEDIPALMQCAEKLQPTFEVSTKKTGLSLLQKVLLTCATFGIAPVLWQRKNAAQGSGYFDFFKDKKTENLAKAVLGIESEKGAKENQGEKNNSSPTFTNKK
jgi:hypothetical protein